MFLGILIFSLLIPAETFALDEQQIGAGNFADHHIVRTNVLLCIPLAFPILGLSKHAWTFAANTP
jgi:hypothetical protein